MKIDLGSKALHSKGKRNDFRLQMKNDSKSRALGSKWKKMTLGLELWALDGK